GRRAQGVRVERAADPRVVDEEVELAERADGGLKGRLPVRLARHVELHEPRLSTGARDLLDDLTPLELHDIRDDHLCAFSREDRGFALPHTARPTRDERDLACQPHTPLLECPARSRGAHRAGSISRAPPSIAESPHRVHCGSPRATLAPRLCALQVVAGLGPAGRGAPATQGANRWPRTPSFPARIRAGGSGNPSSTASEPPGITCTRPRSTAAASATIWSARASP